MARRTRADKLTARWDAIPAERQAFYRRAYQRELANAGATTDDAAELAILRRLITAYKTQGLVPVGTRWASVPERVRRAAKQGQPLHDVGQDTVRTTRSGPPRAAILLVIPLLGLLVFGIVALARGNTGNDQGVTDDTTTLTPETGPTATPLALEESDPVIRAGAGRNRDYFPVLLQVDPGGGQQPRVFVVQERAVGTADWHFDPDPDVASWVSGLLVQPVLGLPYSADNAALLDALGPGTQMRLQMNTGATLAFDYTATRRVTRSETDVFRQVEPGIALILIGETGDDGRLTQDRPVVTGTYPVDQEVARLGAGDLAPVVLPGQPGPVAGIEGLAITVLDTETSTPDVLPDDVAYALVTLEVATGADPGVTGTLRWLLEDADGNRFSPDTRADGVIAFQTLPDELPPHTSVQGGLGFLVPRGLTAARLFVSTSGGEPTAFALTFEPPGLQPTVDRLDVGLRHVSYDRSGVYVDVRLFNPLDTAVPLDQAEPYIVLGYEPDPVGPELAPRSASWPRAVAPSRVLDVSLTFPYDGEPYARLSLSGRTYTLTIHGGT